MASNEKARGDPGSPISFGERRRELRRAEDVAKKIVPKLSLDVDAPRVFDKDLGSDPYNTSGGFDRKKNWTRVGKR
jgi:hypothetical protein